MIMGFVQKKELPFVIILVVLWPVLIPPSTAIESVMLMSVINICEGDNIPLKLTFENGVNIVSKSKLYKNGGNFTNIMIKEDNKREEIFDQRLVYNGPTNVVLTHATADDSGPYEMHVIFRNGKKSWHKFLVNVATGCPDRSAFYDIKIAYVQNETPTKPLSPTESVFLEVNKMGALNISLPKADPPVLCQVSRNGEVKHAAGLTDRDVPHLSTIRYEKAGTFSVTIRLEHSILTPASTRIVNIIVTNSTKPEERSKSIVQMSKEMVCEGDNVPMKMSLGSDDNQIGSLEIYKNESTIKYLMKYVDREEPDKFDERLSFRSPFEIVLRKATLEDTGTYHIDVNYKNNNRVLYTFQLIVSQRCPDTATFYHIAISHIDEKGQVVTVLQPQEKLHIPPNTIVNLNITLPKASPPVSCEYLANDSKITASGSEEKIRFFNPTLFYKNTGNYTIVLRMRHAILMRDSTRVIEVVVSTDKMPSERPPNIRKIEYGVPASLAVVSVILVIFIVLSAAVIWHACRRKMITNGTSGLYSAIKQIEEPTKKNGRDTNQDTNHSDEDAKRYLRNAERAKFEVPDRARKDDIPSESQDKKHPAGHDTNQDTDYSNEEATIYMRNAERAKLGVPDNRAYEGDIQSEPQYRQHTREEESNYEPL